MSDDVDETRFAIGSMGSPGLGPPYLRAHALTGLVLKVAIGFVATIVYAICVRQAILLVWYVAFRRGVSDGVLIAFMSGTVAQPLILSIISKAVFGAPETAIASPRHRQEKEAPSKRPISGGRR